MCHLKFVTSGLCFCVCKNILQLPFCPSLHPDWHKNVFCLLGGLPLSVQMLLLLLLGSISPHFVVFSAYSQWLNDNCLQGTVTTVKERRKKPHKTTHTHIQQTRQRLLLVLHMLLPLPTNKPSCLSCPHSPLVIVSHNKSQLFSWSPWMTTLFHPNFCTSMEKKHNSDSSKWHLPVHLTKHLYSSSSHQFPNSSGEPPPTEASVQTT